MTLDDNHKRFNRKDDMISFPNKKYDIIYADPPWQYKDKALAGDRGSICKYNVMSYKELLKLDIHSISNDDCALFMWSTMPMLSIATTLMEAWGFVYKTVAFTWIKKTVSGKLFWGMGNWTRANAEVCLLGIKGEPKRIDAGVHSVVESQIREHSRKPDEVRDRIVQLMGDLPRIELFARQRVEGWDCWGDEVQ